MSGTTTAGAPAPATARSPDGARPRLTRGWRRATLVLHVVSAGAWIGIDVIVAVLLLTGWFSDDPEARRLAYQALATFVVWPMPTAGLVCLATGLVLGSERSGGCPGTGGSRSSTP